MLDLPANIDRQYLRRNVATFWVLKLYYNDETAFIGVSDRHREDGGDVYHGLVATWGQYQQSLDFFSFTTSTGNMTVKLINTQRSFKGGRLSDQLATYNFANRKWELFAGVKADEPYDDSTAMIGNGIISGDIDFDTKSLTLILLDMSSRYYKTIPRNTVNSTDHPNAPDKNYGMPIPMSYGDFWEKEDIGTIPTTNFDRFLNFYKGAFPAIVTDKWHATNYRVEAACDILSLTTLDTDNIYGHFKNHYAQCENGTKDQPSAQITAKGDDWRFYLPLLSHATYASGGGSAWTNYANTINGVFDDGSYVTFLAGSGAVANIGWRIPKFEKLGTLTAVYLLMSSSNGTGAPSGGLRVSHASGGDQVLLVVGDGANMSGIDGEHIETITGFWGGTDGADWDLEDDLFLVLDDSTSASGSQSIRLKEVGIMIQFKPEDGFDTQIDQIHEFFVSQQVLDPKYGAALGQGTMVSSKRRVVTSVNAVVPSVSSYLFYSGKGRKSGAWSDTDTAGSTARVNGLNKGNVIESPIYIIEDILRTECGTITKGTATSDSTNKLVDSGSPFTASMVGQTAYNLTDGTSAFITALDSATTVSLGADVFDNGNENYYICGLTDDEIDTATFEIAGNTASSAGKVYNALGGAAATSEWAFAQMKFTGVQDLIVRISRQCGAYVFISNGKFKIRTLQQSGYSEDLIVDFNDISLKNISLTPLNNVRNDFVVHYNKDYATGQYQNTVTGSDSTSQGTGATGYNQELTLEIDADVVSSTTATQIAGMYEAFFKDRRPIIEFECLRPLYNVLEITDIIKFSNWDTNIKIFGTAMGTDYYMITDIAKSVNGCSCKTIKVS